MEKGLRIIVDGRVQGVGYRQYISKNARMSSLKGLVRNLPDGKVEIHAIGNENNLFQFLQLVKKGTAFSWVSHTEIEDLIPEKEYRGFEIEY